MSAHEGLRSYEVKGGSDRSFGFVMAAALELVGLWPRVHGRPIRWWAVAAGMAFFAAAWMAPRILKPLNRVWTLIGALLNRVVSPVVSAVVFYVAVTPVGILIRRMGKDPLRLAWNREAGSYWILREPPGPEPASMARQF